MEANYKYLAKNAGYSVLVFDRGFGVYNCRLDSLQGAGCLGFARCYASDDVEAGQNITVDILQSNGKVSTDETLQAGCRVAVRRLIRQLSETEAAN